MRHTTVDWQGQQFTAAVSIGVSCLVDTDTPSDLFHRADRALYEAKKTGRDQYQMV